jgi:hypothetical protein
MAIWKLSRRQRGIDLLQRILADAAALRKMKTGDFVCLSTKIVCDRQRAQQR